MRCPRPHDPSHRPLRRVYLSASAIHARMGGLVSCPGVCTIDRGLRRRASEACHPSNSYLSLRSTTATPDVHLPHLCAHHQVDCKFFSSWNRCSCVLRAPEFLTLSLATVGMHQGGLRMH